jgi:phage-related tail fiber protein
MSEQFYNILTSLGQAEYSSAISLSIPVALTHMVLGDGNGNYYEPSEGQTSLVNEVYRAGLNSVTTDPDNPGWVIAEMVIPSTEGGWYIREAGLISGTGNLFAVGKFPVTYKPLFSEGAGKELVVRLIFEVSNASAITLVVDPTVVLAKKSDIDDHESGTAHEDIRGGADTHNESTTVHNIPTQIATAVGNHNTDVTAHAGAGYVRNLKPVVNLAVNKLDLFTKSGGTTPDADNTISIAVPDGSGVTFRSRSAYLDGTSQFILADGTAYWGAVSGTDKMKLHKYAIWDGTGLVWALSRYAGFHQVPTTSDSGADDYFHIEAGSSYTKNASHHCVCFCEVWANYNTANSPDWTFYDSSAGVEFSPQIVWNPKSDYGYFGYYSGQVSGSDIAAFSAISKVVKQPGKYNIWGQSNGRTGGGYTYLFTYIKVGSATYSSATQKAFGQQETPGTNYTIDCHAFAGEIYLNAGDTIHLGIAQTGASGDRHLHFGYLMFKRAD